MHGIPTRETCAICDSIIVCGFKVPDELWREVLKPFYHNSCVCLNCFARHADEKLLTWEHDIRLYPISRRTNLANTGWAVVPDAATAEVV